MSHRTNIIFTDEMHDELQRLADERGVSVAYIVREAIAAYLERSRIRVDDVHPEHGGWRGGEREAAE